MLNSILFISLKEVIKTIAINTELENLQRIHLLGNRGYTLWEKSSARIFFSVSVKL